MGLIDKFKEIREHNLERGMSKYDENIEIKKGRAKAFREIPTSRPKTSFGFPGGNFGATGSVRSVAPTKFYDSFVYYIENAVGEDEKREILTKYINAMVFGDRGFASKAAAHKKLMSVLERHNKGMGLEEGDL